MSCKRASRHRILRSCTGSSLALVVTVFIGILVVLAFFALSFVRTVGGHQEQETAIEAASLAAAKSLSKVVIDDPTVGLVGLSNSPPAYKNTMAQDNYYTPAAIYKGAGKLYENDSHTGVIRGDGLPEKFTEGMHDQNGNWIRGSNGIS